MPDCPFSEYILCNIFGEGSNSVSFCERLATLIMKPEEHLENDEISFLNVYGHREPIKFMDPRSAHYIL